MSAEEKEGLLERSSQKSPSRGGYSTLPLDSNEDIVPRQFRDDITDDAYPSKDTADLDGCVTDPDGVTRKRSIGGRYYRSLTMSQRLSTNEVAESLSLSWHNINVWAPTASKKICGSSDNYDKHLLRNVSGLVPPGTLLAVMGASGAGKTTLLNVLTYRNRGTLYVEGDVKVNGGAVGKGMASMSAYIQQEDIFIGTLTVKEHLWFQAQLRIDRDVDYSVREARVDVVMKEMSLAKCADVLIGIPGQIKGISGGEKKRLAVASEVLTNPPLMFCDEPTSGLDSFMAQTIVNTLRDLAGKGRTIICTIHQPSSDVFSLFDRLLLVADGRIAFMGHSSKALEFFDSCGYPCPSNYNPADHYIQTLAIIPGKEDETKSKVAEMCHQFQRSFHGKELNKMLENEKAEDAWEDESAFKDQSPYKASWFRQFIAVLWRSWLGVNREPGVFKTRLGQALILSTIFGLTYWQQMLDQKAITNINGALFLMQTQMTYGFVFSVINSFPPEFPVFLREHHDGMYRVDVYFLSKTVAEVVQFITIPALFGGIMYWMVGLYPALPEFVICLLVLILVCNCSVSFGYVLSCSSSNVALVLALAPIFVVPFMVTGGFFINTETIPVYLIWLKYISWFTYANRVLVVNQWTNVDTIACGSDVPVVDVDNATVVPTTIQPPDGMPCLHTGQDVIRSVGFQDANIWVDVGLLVVLMVVYRLLAFLILCYRARRNYKLHKPGSLPKSDVEYGSDYQLTESQGSKKSSPSNSRKNSRQKRKYKTSAAEFLQEHENVFYG